MGALALGQRRVVRRGASTFVSRFAAYRLASEKGFSCRVLGCIKIILRKSWFFVEEEMKNEACAYKTIDLYAQLITVGVYESKTHRSLRARLNRRAESR